MKMYQTFKWICSICGYQISHNTVPCPHCGAREWMLAPRTR